MANTQGICKSFKVELLNGIHAFGTTVARGGTTKDTFKFALYMATATIDTDDTIYTTAGEMADTGDYTAGGKAVTNANAPTSTGSVAWWNPSGTTSWSNITSGGNIDCALLYNDTQGDKAVAVYVFSAQNVTAGSFALTMPADSSSTALLQIA